MNDETMGGEIPQRAVSLYGQNDAVDDFPVLKAFQQYIDAEQEKARKRLIGLGVIFGSVLIAVVIVFMILLQAVNTRNQSLSDRLVEYAMKEADRRQAQAPAPAPVVPRDDTLVKAMIEKFDALQSKIQADDKNQQSSAQQSVADSEHDRKIREEAIAMEREKMRLAEEKKKLAAEKEALRQAQIENQRRKLYPEFYEKTSERKEDAPSPSLSARRNRTVVTDDDIREILREAYSDDAESNESPVSESVTPDTAKQQKKPKAKAAEAEKEVTEEPEGAIEYFKDDEYSIPVDVKDGSSKPRVTFTVPVT